MDSFCSDRMESKSTSKPPRTGTARLSTARPKIAGSPRPGSAKSASVSGPASAKSRTHSKQPPRPVSSQRPSGLEPAPAWLAVSRGVSLFIGAFALLTVFGELQTGGFDANFGWIDLRPCPAPVARGGLALGGIVLVLFGLFPNMPESIRSVGLLSTMVVLAIAVANAVQFGRLRREGILNCENDLSYSIHLIVALTVCVFGLGARPRRSVQPFQNLLLMTTAFVVCAATLPLTLFACSERTTVNYDSQLVAVVGPSSVSPNEQMQQAVSLLKQPTDQIVVAGLVRDGGEALKQKLTSMGHTSAVTTETATLESSVRYAADHARRNGLTRIAVVSDFHQLPRAKNLFRRHGFDVVAVPVGSFKTMPMAEHRMIVEAIAFYRSYTDLLMVGPAKTADAGRDTDKL